MKRVLITCGHLQRMIDRYRPLFTANDIEIECPPFAQQMSESELLEIIDRFDGVIAGDDPYTACVLEKGRRLKVVAKWGIGMDAIDREAAARLGIRVINTPDAFGDEVADVAMGYIILLARHLHKLDQSVRAGGWEHIQGTSLRGKTLGVIGVGSIGRALVRRAAASGMLLIGYDPIPVPEGFLQETGLRVLPLDEMLPECDFLALCCHLTQANRHMLSAREFSRMKKGVRIINVARGPLIDEKALVDALREGKVTGAALDVFEEEPLPLSSPLREFDSCIFGTHNSSNTLEAVLRVNERTIQNLLDGLGGADP